MPFIDRNVPFHEPLVPANVSDHPRPLFHMPCRPDVLIKLMSPCASDMPPKLRASMTNGWREFGSFNGINIPDFLALEVKGRNSIQGKTTERDLWIVKDMIKGTNLEHISEETVKSLPFQQAIKRLFAGLINYGRFKLVNGGWVVTDQKPEQYVWGTTRKKPIPALYFVDLDSLGGVFNPQFPESYPNLIHDFIQGVYKMAVSAEGQFAINLERERFKMQKIKEEAKRYTF
jgi:hypothetical protein